MSRTTIVALCLLLLSCASCSTSEPTSNPTAAPSSSAAAPKAEPLKVLIVDGQNNHNWQATTPVMKKYLEDSKQFTVDVATSPEKGKDMAGFKPEFKKYDVVLLNYNGDRWSKETEQAFIDYVNGG